MSNFQKIPESFIEDLLLRVDLVELIGKKIKLKKTGANYSACCPFHQEKTPSFSVSPSKQFYHCFGCGAHGDAIRFVREMEGLGFVESVQRLAEQVGLKLPEQGEIVADPLHGLYAILKKAAQFFVRQLENAPLARAYLIKRGFSQESIERFGLGYAPDSWDALSKLLGTDPEKQDLLEKAGLAVRKDGRIYDRFRGRLIFPIYDKRGRVLGFGGRVLDEALPKYLNSPESAVFHKGRLLFGINLLANNTHAYAHAHVSQLIIVEGYMDALMLCQAGYSGVVASLGTALTVEQIKLLFSLNAQLLFCFDGDKAGLAASEKALRLLLPFLEDGRSVRFAFLPEGSDPDSLVREQGRRAFDKVLEEAIPLSTFFFKQLERIVAPTTIDNRAHFMKLAKPLLYELPKGVFRDLMFSKLSEILGTERSFVRAPYRPRVAKPSLGKEPPSPACLALALLVHYPELLVERDQEDLALLSGLPGEDIKKLRDYLGARLASKTPPTVELGLLSAWVELIPAEGAKRALADLFEKLKSQRNQYDFDQLLLQSKERALNAEEKQHLKQLLTQL